MMKTRALYRSNVLICNHDGLAEEAYESCEDNDKDIYVCKKFLDRYFHLDERCFYKIVIKFYHEQAHTNCIPVEFKKQYGVTCMRVAGSKLWNELPTYFMEDKANEKLKFKTGHSVFYERQTRKLFMSIEAA